MVTRAASRPVPPFLPYLLLVAAFGSALTLTALARYTQFRPFNQDFTYHLQCFWHFLHYGTFADSVYHNYPLFFGHFFPAVVLFLPLFALTGESPQGLIIVQIAVLMAGCWPIYRAAGRLLGHTVAPVFLAALLCYPALQFAAVFSFAPMLCGLLPFSWALYYLLVEPRPRRVMLCVLLAITTQEVYCYCGFVIGAWMCLTHRRRAGLMLMAICALLFWLITAWYFPLMHSNPLLRDAREISHGWYMPITSAPTTAAAFAAASRTLVMPLTISFALAMLLPLAALPLAVPRLLLIAVGIAAPYAFSSFAFTREIYTYYAAIIIPPLWFAALFGVRRGARVCGDAPGMRLLLAGACLFAAVAAMISASPLFVHNRPFIYYPGIYHNPRAASIRQAIALIPDERSVMTIPVLSEHLFRRRQLEVIFMNSILAPTSEYILFDLREYNWIVDIEAPFAPVFLHTFSTALRQGTYAIRYYQDGIILAQRSPAASVPPNWPGGLADDFARAFRRAFARAGIPEAQLAVPLLYSAADRWPSIARDAGNDTVTFPVIAGQFPPASPASWSWSLTDAAGHELMPQHAHSEPALLAFDATPLADGVHHLTLRLIVGGATTDSYVLNVRKDTRPPVLTAVRDGRNYRLRAHDELSPFEIWQLPAAAQDKIFLTTPLIREWLGETTLRSVYHEFPGGQHSFDRMVPAGTYTASDLAGNCTTLILPGL